MTEEQVLGQFYSDDHSWNKPIEQKPEFWGTGLKQCTLVGIGSDIGKAMAERLKRDGWEVNAVSARTQPPPEARWDLLVLMHGTLEPVGRFFDADQSEWELGMGANALDPLCDLRTAWEHRKEGAKVIFMGGPNMAKPSPTYSAYRAGKAILESLCTTLEAENPGHSFKVFHPGVVNTKIHQQTLEAGERAANVETVREIVSGERRSRTIDEVYADFKAML